MNSPSKLAAFAALATAPFASAATLTWDPGATDGAVNGGSGNWNATEANWTTDAGATNLLWTAGNTASFGGTAGTVTVAPGQAAVQLAFTTTGYTLTGGSVTLSGATSNAGAAIYAGSGVRATINSNLANVAGKEVWFGGGGTVVLGGANTFTNSIVITGGSTLEIADMAALGGTGNLFFNGTTAGNTFRYTGDSANFTKLSAQWGLNSTPSTIEVTKASTVLTLNQNLQNNNSTASSVVKTGAGTMLMTGANIYTGATSVNGGKLLVNGSLASAVGVNSAGATLGGIGTVNNAVTVASGAILQGGQGAASGTLTITGGVTLASGSVIRLALGAGGAHSSLAFTGAESFQSGQIFDFIDAGAEAGATYAGIITGVTTPGPTGGWTVANAGWSGIFTYNPGTSSVDFTLTSIPEPATCGLLGAGTLALLAAARRRHARPPGATPPGRTL